MTLSKRDLKIIYMGTPEFAVAPLDALLNNGYDICAVVTSPDKPAGRGLKISISPVKQYALENDLHLMQPTNLKDPEFIETLKKLQPDIQIVVAFRMLPEAIWKLPPLGTINLHASLLPNYRGAAPINHAIINGETETGVTTFFINENIDTGNLIMAEKVIIEPDEAAGELHDKLMNRGASLILKTLDSVRENNINTIAQESILASGTVIKPAPRIFKEDCRIKWNTGTDKVYNHIRGLSPYPAAFTELISPQGIPFYLKIFRCEKEITKHSSLTGQVKTDAYSYISIAVPDGFIHLLELQIASKRKMRVNEFLRGFPLNCDWNVTLT